MFYLNLIIYIITLTEKNIFNRFSIFFTASRSIIKLTNGIINYDYFPDLN